MYEKREYFLFIEKKVDTGQSTPEAIHSEIFKSTICPLSYCTKGLEYGSITFTSPNHSEWNELYHSKMRQHITQQHICLHEKSAEPECEDGEGVKNS